MQLTLNRDTFTEVSTEGELTFDDGTGSTFPVLYTLELPNKDGLPGSCIPAGTYPVILAPSPKFSLSNDPWVLRYSSVMPHIIQIPDRTLIMIHWLNTVIETDGCVGVGLSRAENFIGSSRKAFEMLWDLIQMPARSNDCSIEVIGGA